MSEMNKPSIIVVMEPKSPEHRHLSTDLIHDLNSLLRRHASLMIDAKIANNDALGLILSVLAIAGLRTERDSKAPVGTFIEMARALAEIEVKKDDL